MRKFIKDKIKESASSIIPVMIIMLIISLFLGFNATTIFSVIISTLLLIIGTSLFTLGAEISMIEVGKIISSSLLKTRKLLVIAIVCFVIGVVITVAEPDLQVLANQMTAIDSWILILCVGIGTGLFLCIAALRIIFQANLKIILACFYIMTLSLLIVSNNEIIPLAFDSGGVTAGPMSVPLIIAMGIGFSSSKARRKTTNDSFGLISLSSIGPVLTVLILGLFIGTDMTYTYKIEPETTNFIELLTNYISEFMPVLKDTIILLLPILALFISYNIIFKTVKKKQFAKISFGLIITLIGLTLFFLGVNAGYMPISYLIGIEMYKKSKTLLIILGLIIGFLIVKAEPAIAVLTEQIEKITEGSIKKNIMNNTIAIGVSLAVVISIVRVILGISINGFLIVGCILAILLMLFTPDIFTMVAFDSGGAAAGTMTTSFLLPLIIGICYACNGNVLTDAFGIVGLVALSPLITIQILGIIYNIKSNKQTIVDSLDETIIEFKRGEKLG